MALLRILILKGMTENIRIFARHLPRKLNKFSDYLSRGMLLRFKKEGKGSFEEYPTEIPESLWPIDKLWIN